MNFEQKKRSKIEMDELNIRSHLNTFLEADEISVSEDLISRTMDAIRLNELNDSNRDKEKNKDHKPLFFRHTRTFVTAVAAVLVLVVGISVLKNSPIGMKSQMSKSDDSVGFDAPGTTELYSIKEDACKYDVADSETEAGNGFEADRNKDSDLVDSGKPDTPVENKSPEELKRGLEDEISKGTHVDDVMKSSDEYMLSFSDITLMEPTDIKGVILASEISTDMSMILDKEKIENFNSIMDKHVFKQENESDTNFEYTIILISEDKECQINVRETSVTVNHTDNGEISYIIYVAADHDMLLKDLKELLTYQ